MKTLNLKNFGKSGIKISSNSGYFQISLKRIQDAVAAGAKAEHVMAYLVLAGGAQGGSSQPRASTHGRGSVAKRSKIRAPDRAIKWLAKEGFISKANDARHHGANGGAATWLVDPEDDCDLSICQNLFGEGLEFATLGSLQELTNGDSTEITKSLAVLDALMIFLHLHKNQDFGEFAGVDPSVAHHRCELIEPDEDGELTDAVVRLSSIEGMALVTHRAADEIALSPEFAHAALGNIKVVPGGPGIQRRACHALSELIRLRFVYQALVAWNGDPVSENRFAEPLGTLYVHDSWARGMDSQTQYAVHDTLLGTGARPGNEFFMPDEGRPWHSGSGIYRNLVEESALRRYTLLSQLRVRHWPADKDTVQGRADMAARDAAIKARLQQVISASQTQMQAVA